MTILRDETTERGDFIFYADRLSTLIVEKALTLVPCRDVKVTTPVGASFTGKEWPDEDLVGISILRSGGPFSHGLRRVLRDVPIGALLIQSDPKTGEPLLLKSDLPRCIKDASAAPRTRVLLLDSQMGTGAAAMMAIRVLLDHRVPAERIVVLAFLVSRQGLRSVRRAYPGVRIVTAAIDGELREMRLPLRGRGAVGGGEGDYAVRLVQAEQTRDVDGAGDGDDEAESGARSPVHGHKRDLPAREENEGDLRNALQLDQSQRQRDFGHPAGSTLDELRFSREMRPTSREPAQKRAWVIAPGMGHIG